MQLSTNLPTIRQYINAGVPLAANVSGEADSSFLAELKRTDPDRYRRLAANMERQAYAATRIAHDDPEGGERRCQYCKLKLPPDIRADARYCDTTCQRCARRSRPAA